MRYFGGFIRARLNIKTEPKRVKEKGEKIKEELEAGAEREYYANLELPFGSSFSAIKKNYRTLIHKYHPDRHHADPSNYMLAKEVSVKLNEAFEYFASIHSKRRSD